MLIRTGLGSISLVAGCCWVNSVARPVTRPPLTGSPRRKPQSEGLEPTALIEESKINQGRGGSRR